MYQCPKCKEKLVLKEHSYKCLNNHCFDVAKEGYVNLLLSNTTNHGDNKEMVKARHEFLQKGYYQPLANKLKELIQSYNTQTLIDLGCGEGYYTSKLSSVVTDCYANDLSKEAIKLASKHDKHTNYFIATSASLPFADESFDAATVIFSYVDFKEYARILKDKGKLLIVMPAAKHLFELKQAVYDTPYLNEEIIKQDDHFVLQETINVSYEINLKQNADILELFKMTPYYFKTKKEDLAKLEKLDTLTTSVAFLINVYEKL